MVLSQDPPQSTFISFGISHNVTDVLVRYFTGFSDFCWEIYSYFWSVLCFSVVEVQGPWGVVPRMTTDLPPSTPRQNTPPPPAWCATCVRTSSRWSRGRKLAVSVETISAAPVCPGKVAGQGLVPGAECSTRCPRTGGTSWSSEWRIYNTFSPGRGSTLNHA